MTPAEQQRCREAFEAVFSDGRSREFYGTESCRQMFEAAWQAQEERTQKLVEALKWFADHLIVKSGRNDAVNQYGHLELWWAAKSVHEEASALYNPWMLVGSAENSYALAAMGEVAAALKEALAAHKAAQPRGELVEREAKAGETGFDEPALATTLVTSLMRFDGMVEDRARTIVDTFLTIVRPHLRTPAPVREALLDPDTFNRNLLNELRVILDDAEAPPGDQLDTRLILLVERMKRIERALQNLLNGIDTGAITSDHDEVFANAVKQAKEALAPKPPATGTHDGR